MEQIFKMKLKELILNEGLCFDAVFSLPSGILLPTTSINANLVVLSKSNNGDTYARLQKEKTALYKMLPDEDDTPADYFEPRKNEFVYDPSLLGVTPVSNAKMRELIDQIKRETGIEDIDYTIIENEHEENPL